MISQLDFENIKFSKTESDKFEFKESVCEKAFDKYVETICGSLNTNSGYLIFGIADDLNLIGLKINSKELDKFILRFDTIINAKNIVGINKLTNEIVNLSPISIKQTQITNKYGKQFLAIQVIPEPNIKYQLANGKIYYRLGASNYYDKNEKIYKQSDFDNACKNIKTKAEQENKANIELFQKTLQEKNKQISEVVETNNIYKQHLEGFVKLQNHKDSQIKVPNEIMNRNLNLSSIYTQQITNYNSEQYGIYQQIIKTIFPCLG